MSNSINISKVNLVVASANLDGIQFNNIQRSGHNSTKRYIPADTPWYTLDNSTPVKPAVNAVDIDWNEAVIPYGNLETGGSATVNSTGELLSLISRMQQEIFELSATVTALNNNAVTKGSDTSMARVTVNFDSANTGIDSVSINGNTCNSGDVNYYRVGTVLDFIATVDAEYTDSYWFATWEVNKVSENTSYTYQSAAGSGKFSLIVNATDNITVTVSFSVTSAPHPNPDPGLWPETTDSGVSGEDAL